ncbi:MAG TPA: hypothetical protein VH280_11425 [Verrucomicrobiae bacterium]|nr:hypothetical protein [Verrucomicrobiae bacterium]
MKNAFSPTGRQHGRLEMLTQQEKFVIAAFGADYEPGANWKWNSRVTAPKFLTAWHS